MKYTVIWKPSALRRLTSIWLAAPDKDALNGAVSQIDRHLQQNAGAGVEHLGGTLLIVAPPLVVAYEVNHGDCQAIILNVAFHPQMPSI